MSISYEFSNKLFFKNNPLKISSEVIPPPNVTVTSSSVIKTDASSASQTQLIKVSNAPMLSQALASSGSVILSQKASSQPQNVHHQVKQVLVHQQNKPNSLLVAQLCGKNIILNKSTVISRVSRCFRAFFLHFFN